MKDVLKKANLKPVADAAMMDAAPDKLKDQGIIDLEKKSYDWSDAAAEITIDEVIMGNVLQTAQGQNPARQAMIAGGLPKETPAFTSGIGLLPTRPKQLPDLIRQIAWVFVRQVTTSAIVIAHKDRVQAGMQKIMTSRQWTDPQRKWLERIGSRQLRCSFNG